MVPRLELLACALLSKLIVSVKKAVTGLLNIRNVFCWSDSQISLWRIRQVRKDWKVWIENGVQVIRKNVAPGYWMHVPIDINPADITTRLLSPNTFVSCELWWRGPDFLQFLLRVTCYVRRFVEKVILGKVGKVCSGEISAEEMDCSIKLWIKHEQLLLQRESNFKKMKHSLCLFFDEENLLRCRTRISSDETLNYGMRFPILLQRSSNFTKLIILHYHDKVYHCGVEATLKPYQNFLLDCQRQKNGKINIKKKFYMQCYLKESGNPRRYTHITTV